MRLAQKRKTTHMSTELPSGTIDTSKVKWLQTFFVERDGSRIFGIGEVFDEGNTGSAEWTFSIDPECEHNIRAYVVPAGDWPDPREIEKAGMFCGYWLRTEIKQEESRA